MCWNLKYWSKWIAIFLFGSLAAEASAESADSVMTFRFAKSIDMFYSPYLDNEPELERMLATVDCCRSELSSGRVYIYVSAYCGSCRSEAENLAVARVRANRVKSELITRKRLKEENFRTMVAAAADDSSEVVVVIFLASAPLPAAGNGADAQVLPAGTAEPMQADSTQATPAGDVAPGDSAAVSPTGAADSTQMSAVPEQPDTMQLLPPATEAPDLADGGNAPAVNVSGNEPPAAAGSAPVRPSRQAGPKPYALALKTNMLYDVLLVPNIGLEFCAGKGWSVGANVMYAWWSREKSDFFWRIYGGELYARKYLGRQAAAKPFTGHHVGVYGQIFDYDFELGGRGYMGGEPGGTLWDKMNYAMGVEYGYSLPITRGLSLDFTLGIGYWGGQYCTYEPQDGEYVWQETWQRHWFGPTKAEVSLVWMFGRGVIKGKGGRR